MVTEYAIEEDIQATFVRLFNQSARLFHGAEVGIDLEIIAGKITSRIQPIGPDILAKLGRRLEDWRQPDGIDPRALDVIQAIGNTLKITLVLTGTVADVIVMIAVAIDEGLHHDLHDA